VGFEGEASYRIDERKKRGIVVNIQRRKEVKKKYGKEELFFC